MVKPTSLIPMLYKNLESVVFLLADIDVIMFLADLEAILSNSQSCGEKV